MKGDAVKKGILGFGILILFANDSYAVYGTKTEFYYGAGLSLPAGPDTFKTFWDKGINLGGGIGYSFLSRIALIAYFDYTSFPLDKKAVIQEFDLNITESEVEGESAKILHLSGNLKLSPFLNPKTFSPFVSGGIGILKYSSEVVRTPVTGTAERIGERSSTGFSTNLGAGLDILIPGPLDIFLEGRYIIGFTEGESTSYIPLRGGLKAGF